MAAIKVGDTVDVVEKGKSRLRGTVTATKGPAGTQSVDVTFDAVRFAEHHVRKDVPHISVNKSFHWIEVVE